MTTLTQLNGILIPDNKKKDFQRTIFNVDERPIPYIRKKKILDGVDNFSADYSIDLNRKMIVNEDDDKFISIVSNDYTVVKNSKIIEVINNIGVKISEENGAKLRLVEANIFANSRTKYVFVIDNMKKELFSETIMPRITVINSYSGDSRFKIFGGILVLACTNGMMFPKTVSGISKVHSGEIDFENALNKFENVLTDSGSYAEKAFKLLTKISFSPNGLIQTLEMFPRKGKDAMLDYMGREKCKNYYDLLQAGTNVISHSMERDVESVHNLEQAFVPKLIKIADADKHGRI